MTDSDDDSDSATGRSSTNRTDDADTDQPASKYVIGDSPIDRSQQPHPTSLSLKTSLVEGGACP